MLIKNPFTRPVWIERVHVSLPSELMLADNPAERQRLRGERKEAEARRREEFRANARKAAELNESLERLSRLIEDSRRALRITPHLDWKRYRTRFANFVKRWS